MIKNIKDLDEQEYREFYQLYLDYFNEIRKNEANLLQRILLRLIAPSNEAYVNEMIKRIDNINMCYIHTNESNNVQGFIVGKEDENKVGWISHLYIKPEIGQGKKQKEIALELYSSLAQEMKNKWIDKVITEAKEYEYPLKDILCYLDFDSMQLFDDGAEEYEKQI